MALLIENELFSHVEFERGVVDDRGRGEGGGVLQHERAAADRGGAGVNDIPEAEGLRARSRFRQAQRAATAVTRCRGSCRSS